MKQYEGCVRRTCGRSGRISSQTFGTEVISVNENHFLTLSVFVPEPNRTGSTCQDDRPIQWFSV